MENASKALIIAGAILLAILIISLGLMAYNGARNNVAGSTLDKQEIEAFNSQWEAFIGDNKSANDVKAMVSAIIASNAAESNSGKHRFVSLSNAAQASTNVLDDAPTGIAMPTSLVNSASYTISVGYGSNGLVVGMAYNVNSSTP